MPRNGRARHILSNINPEAGTADCAECGPVQLKSRGAGKGYRCKAGWLSSTGDDTKRWKVKKSLGRAQLLTDAVAALKSAGMPGGETPSGIRGLSDAQLRWLVANAPRITPDLPPPR